MEKRAKFITGGVLIVLLLSFGSWLIYPFKNPTAPFAQKILLPIIFLVVLLLGLKLLADSLIKK